MTYLSQVSGRPAGSGVSDRTGLCELLRGLARGPTGSERLGLSGRCGCERQKVVLHPAANGVDMTTG
jgi:hypothetical protein